MDAMKKLFAVAFLSLVGLGLTVEQAAAWCCHPCCFCCRYRMCVCASQSNAFSPFCVDGVSCRGCCGLCHRRCCCPPLCWGNPCCAGTDCCDGGVLGQLPPTGGVPTVPATPAKPGQSAPGFN